MPKILTQDRLKELLYYHPESGDFVWLNPPKTYCWLTGKQAGGDASGYLQIKVEGKMYKASRLAWFYVYGVWPKNEIDHKNGNTYDNKFSNFRDVTHLKNMQNHTRRQSKKSGLPLGVSRHKSGKFEPQIRANGIKYYLGTFPTIEEAELAYKAARLRLHDCPAFKENY